MLLLIVDFKGPTMTAGNTSVSVATFREGAIKVRARRTPCPVRSPTWDRRLAVTGRPQRGRLGGMGNEPGHEVSNAGQAR